MARTYADDKKLEKEYKGTDRRKRPERIGKGQSARCPLSRVSYYMAVQTEEALSDPDIHFLIVRSDS